MKISFYIGPRERNIPQPEPFEIPYGYNGQICSVVVYGDIKKPQVLVVPSTPFPPIPTCRYWFFMNVCWSSKDGFQFNKYTDPEITFSLNSTVEPLKTIDTLKGGTQILINKNFITLNFKPEVNQTDLGNNDPKTFLEKCSILGIKVTNINLTSAQSLSNLNCPNIHLENVNFIKSNINYADFSGSKFTNVKFIECNIESVDFTNSLFSKVEFSEAKLRKSKFEKCRVVYNKSRIENEEVLVFHQCHLNDCNFEKAILCCTFDNCDLSNANFSDAKIVASNFYDCQLNQTIFTKSTFASFGTQTDKTQKQTLSVTELITCRIGLSKKVETNENNAKKGLISNCKFDSASMRFIDLSYNLIEDTDFEAADLSKAKLYKCNLLRTTFHRKTLKSSANLSSADVSFSYFTDCNLSEVNFSYARMIETEIKKSELDNATSKLVGASFYSANLRDSKFIDSDLTSVDFRLADLTLVNLDKCKLNGANFFQTKRGGINLNITDNKNDNSNEKADCLLLETSCIFDYIEWSPKRDGEIQIDKNDFLRIVSGKTSPLAVISNLSKENPSVISYIYNQNQAQAEANAKSAGNDLNDASVNVGGDVNDSDLSGGSVETKAYGETEQEDIRQSYDSSSDESSHEEAEEG